uniref:Serine palmitoyltransferase 1 n=1 Tax=Macrostomum lignano TaxID=282301 RepID=A0A1I8FDI2_9PLAT
MLIFVADADVSWEFSDLIEAIYSAPTYHLVFEGCLILFIVGLLFQHSFLPSKRRGGSGDRLSKAEEDQLIAEWQPEPLVSGDPADEALLASYQRCATSQVGRSVTYSDGRTLVNFATGNFLDFIGEARIRDRALASLRHYGVGSCGPRGFYGTMDVHLHLEEQLAKFYGCEEAVLYSYGFSTIASAIPSYAKRHDIIFADERCCFAIQQGLEASRSKIIRFAHNDTAHLEELLQRQAEHDRRDPKKARVTRKFIVVEGLYVNCGDICPLGELVKLKYKYKVRLFVEESASLGTLGATRARHLRGGRRQRAGRGSDSGWNRECSGPLRGFVVGTKYVVDHQRLSGLGYCFSASLPPMLAAAASEALTMVDEMRGERTARLKSVSDRLHQRLLAELDNLWSVEGAPMSPIKHLRLHRCTGENSLPALEAACAAAADAGLLLTVARYVAQDLGQPAQPSIRLSVNCNHSDSEIGSLLDFLKSYATGLAKKCFQQLNISRKVRPWII